MLKQISLAGCVLATAGVAFAGDKELQNMEVLYDNGQVNYQGVQIVNNDLVPPMGIIYDNGGDNYSNGLEMTNWLEAEDFTLAAQSTVEHVDFSVLDTLAGNNLANWDGTGDWFIYADAGGTPGTLVASGAGTNFTTAFDRFQTWDFWDFGMDLDTPVNLAPGTYWLGLHLNVNSGCVTRDELYWATTDLNGTNDHHLDLNCDGGFSPLSGFETSFSLSGTSQACLDLQITNLVGGQTATFDVSGGEPGERAIVAWGTGGPPSVFIDVNGWCASFGFNIQMQGRKFRIAGSGIFDNSGVATIQRQISENRSGMHILFQAAEHGTCPGECMSDQLIVVIG